MEECRKVLSELEEKAKESAQLFRERTGIATINENKLSNADKNNLNILLEVSCFMELIFDDIEMLSADFEHHKGVSCV